MLVYFIISVMSIAIFTVEVAHVLTPHIQKQYKDILRFFLWGSLAYFIAAHPHIQSKPYYIKLAYIFVLFILGVGIPWSVAQLERTKKILSFLSALFAYLPHKPKPKDETSMYQTEMMQRFDTFKKTPVKNIMTPLEYVFSLSSEKQICEALEDVRATGYSRIPVFKEKNNFFNGVLYARDVLTAFWLREDPDRSISEIMLPLVSLSQDMMCYQALEKLKEEHQHVAQITNQNNETLGIITFEDLVEELVGEIKDERDI